MTDYQKATSFAELHKATLECARGVRWKDSVQEYLRNILPRTITLRNDLLRGTYKIQPYIRFYILSPKRREIVSTRLRDRIFQRSMCNNGLYRNITQGFIYDNCACQLGKGLHFALNRLQCHMQRMYRKTGPRAYALKLDIKKFFPSIPHTIAKAAVAKRVPDPDFVRHVYAIIDSFTDPRPPAEIAADPFGPRGIALGSQVSQLIALAVLDNIDHYIKERLQMRYYVRYMDDLVILHPNKDVLYHCMLTIEAKLAAIGLTLNPKSCIYPVGQGVLFLKQRFIFTASGKVIRRITRQAISRERRKLRALHRLYVAGKITGSDVNVHFTTWAAHMAHANSRGVIAAIKQYGKMLFGQRSEI